MCSADRYCELCPCGALQSSPFGTALLQGPAPLEGWRYSHIISAIQVTSHTYHEFALGAIVISSEAEKSLSVFIFLACFLQGNADPTTAKKHMRLTAHVLFHYLRLNVTGTCELQVIATPFCLAGTNCQP